MVGEKKEMKIFRSKVTYMYSVTAIVQFVLTMLLAGMDLKPMPFLSVFDMDLQHYKYPYVQYWMHIITIFSYPFVMIWLLVSGLKIKQFWFPSKAGSGNAALLLIVGLLFTYYLFVGFEGGNGRFAMALQSSLLGIFLINFCLFMSATGPVAWIVFWVKWKLGERHGKSNSEAGRRVNE